MRYRDKILCSRAISGELIRFWQNKPQHHTWAGVFQLWPITGNSQQGKKASSCSLTTLLELCHWKSVGTRRVGKNYFKVYLFPKFLTSKRVALSPLWCLLWLKCSQDVFARHKPGMFELCTCYRSLIGKWTGYWQMEKQTNELYFASLHFSMSITAGCCWFLLAAPRSRVVLSAGVHCWAAPEFCLEWIHFRNALSDISL